MSGATAWIIYDKECRPVAEAVADGLASTMTVRSIDARVAPARVDPEVRLVVIGAPAHLPAPNDIGRWLGELERDTSDVVTVAFDTRRRRSRRAGSTARMIRRHLWWKGYRTLACATFRVDGLTGSIAQRERQRACRWGEHLATGLDGFDGVVGIRPSSRGS